jgi:hypothetical protein
VSHCYAVDGHSAKVHGAWTLFFWSPRTGGIAPDTVGIRTTDIVRIDVGNAHRLSRVHVRDGAEVIAHRNSDIVSRMSKLTPCDSDALATAFFDAARADDARKALLAHWNATVWPADESPMRLVKLALADARARFARLMGD